MKKRMTAGTKKAILIYIVILLSLYVIVQVLPKVTDIFETTQVLEVGDLALTCETTGYLIKDEYICISDEAGEIKYKDEVGTVVKKGHKVCKVKSDSSKDDQSNRFSTYTDRLGDFKKVTKSYKAPISGVFSLSMDGYEGVFTKEKMTKLDKTVVEGYSYKSVNLERSSISRGEPVYKISGDDEWFVLCWMDKADASHYTVGDRVTLELPAGDVKANVYYVKEEDTYARVIFRLDVYYEEFTDTRDVKMTVIARADEGLICSNDCIIEKDGVKGVYVVNKNGINKFTPISVISTDGINSVLKATTYYDEEGNQVNTVDVYDKVLKHPESALRKDKEEEPAQETTKQTKPTKAETEATQQATDASAVTEPSETTNSDKEGN